MNFKKIFCRHKTSEVICWHWTHGPNGNDPRSIEMQLKCNICGKYYFRYIENPIKCIEFSKLYSDKKWSDNCKPVYKK